MRLILASQSLGRKKLLEHLKIPFEVMPSTIDEEKIIGKTPLETLQLRAKMKGEGVACSPKLPARLATRSVTGRLKSLIPETSNLKPITYLILSADSGAIINNQLIGKPKDYKDAVRILSALSGKTHEFVTAIYIITLSQQAKTRSDLVKRRWQCYDRSFVTFRKLSKGDIKRYLSLTDYTKYAGGYAISSAQDFIVKIEGSISNVVGLPLEKVKPFLQDLALLS